MLYIHGFASCGDSNKTRILKEHFGKDEVLAPDIPVDPDEAMAFLRTLIEQGNVKMIVGSSLGGYYAAYLSSLYDTVMVLINPSTRPYETLAAFVGSNRRWCDGSPFVWKPSYLDALKKYEISEVKKSPGGVVLLQSGDEVLDYRIALQKYKALDVVVEEGGNHRFENLADYLAKIETLYRR